MNLWPYAICGDQHALNSTHGYFEQGISLGGLPIHDKELERMLSYYGDRANKIIWSCGYPLMGWRGIEQIKETYNQDNGIKTIDYLRLGIPRGFIKDEEWKNIPPDDLEFLFRDWRDMLKYWAAKWEEKIILFPLAAYYFDQVLDLPFKAYEILKEQFLPSLDLSPLDEMKPEWWQKERPLLTVEGWNQITPAVEAWLTAQPTPAAP
jgi:hypothetical protein